jgi:hypothetical protein
MKMARVKSRDDMLKSLRSLFIAAATIVGAYSLSQPAQALSRDGLCYSPEQISAAMKAEGQIKVAFGSGSYEISDKPSKDFIYYLNAKEHVGYVVRTDDKRPVECATILGRLENADVFNIYIGSPPDVPGNGISSTNIEPSGICTKIETVRCGTYNDMLWRLGQGSAYPALQGVVESGLYKEPSYKEGGLLPKGTVITIMARVPEKQEGKKREPLYIRKKELRAYLEQWLSLTTQKQ